MNRLTRLYAGIVLGVVLMVTAGCAAIPAEAPELSAELGNRISAIEEANLTLLHRFFDMKRDAVDRFIQEEWVPVFAEEVFSDPRMEEVWNTIVRENNPSDRLKFIVMTGPKLQARINRKRTQLIAPLDDLERRIERNIRDEYQQARAINNAITSFLLSAAKVEENRTRYLEMLGVEEEEISRAIDSVDHAVSTLLASGKAAADKVKKAENYLEELQKIRESL